MRCLLADSSTTIRRILEKALRESGWTEIIHARDGNHALGMVDGVDLLVVDWSLPPTSGLDLIRRLRSRPEAQPFRVLLLTGRNSEEDVKAAIEVGVDGYLLKPFTPEVLRDALNGLLQSAA